MTMTTTTAVARFEALDTLGRNLGELAQHLDDKLPELRDILACAEEAGRTLGELALTLEDRERGEEADALDGVRYRLSRLVEETRDLLAGLPSSGDLWAWQDAVYQEEEPFLGCSLTFVASPSDDMAPGQYRVRVDVDRDQGDAIYSGELTYRPAGAPWAGAPVPAV